MAMDTKLLTRLVASSRLKQEARKISDDMSPLFQMSFVSSRNVDNACSEDGLFIEKFRVHKIIVVSFVLGET